MKEMVGGCCVCSDDRGWSENPLVYCDGQSCTVAVHQACYGIVTVPTGPWYCRKCESQERSVKVKCELCPSKYGALKRTDNSGWAHVVCALYIPEVRFGNVTTMEPIQLQLIPSERFNKICYICEEKGKPSNATVGACMQCNKAGCKQQFHVTCAQGLGLLCEEAGNYLDNVKYCGYCQHHYSKLKKGGNVKTIPPYKPVANEAHNSDSEKEPETGTSKSNISPPTGKKRSSVSGKTTPSKASSKSNNSQQKTVHNNKNADKTKVSNSSSSTTTSSSTSSSSANKSDKSADASTSDQKLDKKDQKPSETAASAEIPDNKEKETVKENKSGKKRKVNSRTPTPVSVSVTASDISVVVTPVTTAAGVTPVGGISSDTKKAPAAGDTGADKIKKAKIDTNQPIVTSQPVIALTSISTVSKASSPTVVEQVSPPELVTQTHAQTSGQIQAQSLVVSVPLVNTLTEHHSIVGGGQVATLPNTLMPERSSSVGSVTERMSVISSGGNSNQGLLSSEMNVGGMKMGYEKQVDSINTEEDMELELEPSPSAIVEEPITRSRTQSNEKTERPSRGKKRNSNGSNSSNQQQQQAGASVNNSTAQKRSSRSQHISPSPESPGAFSAISQTQIKTSPPRTPSPEGSSTASRGSRAKGRKSAPANLNTGGAMKDIKDIKVFQNGLTAPHMLGNQLNPNSTMHSKMNEHLNSEMEAHSIFNPNENALNLVGPPLQHKVVQSTRASSTGSSTASGSSGLSSMLGGGGGGNIPQTLDQLLERQWEQGSQFLMEQAQHFDIASLLSCLHQLRAENMRLEDHVASLLQRRDHLLAVNARLAIPLTGQPAVSQSPTVNNIHPQVNVNDDMSRSHVRTSSANRYPRQGPDPSIASHEDVRSSHRSSSAGRYSGSSQHAPVDNGLPDGYPHSSQHSPTVRHSPVAAYQNSGLHRHNIDGRSAPRPQSYHLYDRPGPSQSQQMVIRDRDREAELYHHKPSKPS